MTILRREQQKSSDQSFLKEVCILEGGYVLFVGCWRIYDIGLTPFFVSFKEYSFGEKVY